MNCLTCDTPILERDCCFRKDSDDGAVGTMHDDCLIRELEFIGDHMKAGEIFRKADEFYKSLPKL